MIARREDLHLAIWKAEEIEDGSGTLPQEAKQDKRHKFNIEAEEGSRGNEATVNAVQTVNLGQQQKVPMQQAQPFAVQSVQAINGAGKANAQCYNCSGYSHYYWECPFAP